MIFFKLKGYNRFVRLSFLKDWVSPWRAYIAEFLGTFIFVLFSCGAVLADSYWGNLGSVGIALCVGFSYAALIYMTSHLSGGFLNPAVTLSLWLVRRLPGFKAIIFIIVQVAASFAAAGTLLFVFGRESTTYFLGGPTVGVNISFEVAVALEAILTAVLVFAVFSTMIDRGGPVSFGPLVIGFVLISAYLIGLPTSGVSLNPARAIGPIVISGNLTNLAIWIISPLAGSLFAVFYNLVFIRKPAKSR